MNELSMFRANATKNGICSEKATIWDKCQSKSDLMDLALCAQGMDYLCDSIGKGWGVSPSYIMDKFKAYNNGRYIYQSPTGYRTAMYCGYRGFILCELTALVVIDSDIELTIPKYHICELYVVGDTKLKLRGEGRCSVNIYGDVTKVKVDVNSALRCKIIHKENRD